MQDKNKIRKIGIYYLGDKNENEWRYKISHEIPSGAYPHVNFAKDNIELLGSLIHTLSSEGSKEEKDIQYRPHLSPHPTKFDNEIRKTIDNLFKLRNNFLE